MIATQDGIIFNDERELETTCLKLDLKYHYDKKNRVGLLSCGILFKIAKNVVAS